MARIGVKAGNHLVVVPSRYRDVFGVGAANRIGHRNANPGPGIVMGIEQIVFTIGPGALYIFDNRGIPHRIATAGRPAGIFPGTVFPVLCLLKDLLGG